MEPVSPAQVARNAAFNVAAPVAAGGAAIATLYNVLANSDGHSATGRRSGLALGLFTVATGASVLMKTDLPAQVGIGTMMLGTASSVIAARAMRNHGVIVAREEAGKRANVAARAQLSPTVDVNGSAGALLHVSLRF
jgi:hypothetical protein